MMTYSHICYLDHLRRSNTYILNMPLIVYTFFIAEGATAGAGDPLSEFCNDLETAPDEVLNNIL